jgi:hypothetical protein
VCRTRAGWLELLSDPVTSTIKPAIAELRGTGQTLQLRPETGLVG